MIALESYSHMFAVYLSREFTEDNKSESVAIFNEHSTNCCSVMFVVYVSRELTDDSTSESVAIFNERSTNCCQTSYFHKTYIFFCAPVVIFAYSSVSARVLVVL